MWEHYTEARFRDCYACGPNCELDEIRDRISKARGFISDRERYHAVLGTEVRKLGRGRHKVPCRPFVEGRYHCYLCYTCFVEWKFRMSRSVGLRKYLEELALEAFLLETLKKELRRFKTVSLSNDSEKKGRR